jgi:hypothetical protein
LVKPLFPGLFPAAKPRQVQAIERAINAAEAVAREAPQRAPDKVVIRLHAAFTAGAKLAESLRKQNPAASAVALAAAQAARAAEYACCDTRKRDAEWAARSAAAAAAVDPSGALVGEIHEGWQRLLAAAQAEGWTKHSPVPESFFKG